MVEFLSLILPSWPLLIESNFLNQVDRLISLYMYSTSMLGIIGHFDLYFAMEQGVSHGFETIEFLHYFLWISCRQPPLRFAAEILLFVCPLASCIVVEGKAWSLIG